jgi:hypothetical protein
VQAGAIGGRDLDQWQTKHHVGGEHADDASHHLRCNVRRHGAPPHVPAHRLGHADEGVEVSARDGPERHDQRDERRADREGIGEQRDGDVAATELHRHDAAADDGRQQQRGADRLCDDDAAQKR